MSPELKPDGGASDTQQGILDQAQARYGADAYFVYLSPKSREPITMTLAQAMEICGTYIAAESPDSLWQTLDKWHEAAKRLEAMSADMFATSLEMGNKAVVDWGRKVGNKGGETS